MTVAVAPAEATPPRAVPILPIGKKLRQLRRESGLSYGWLAALTVGVDPRRKGVHRVTLNRIELDMQTARAETCQLIAAALTQALRRTITLDDLYGTGRRSRLA